LRIEGRTYDTDDAANTVATSMPSEIAVTLICTAEHEAALAGLLRRLELAGLQPGVLFDAQREPERVVEVVQTVGARGLFVLCESGQADELAYRRLESTIAKHGTALHRLIRIDLLARSPMVHVTRIVRECEELAKLAPPHDPSSRPPPAELAPTDEHAGISLPAIRLAPGEQLEGDTMRIDLPDSPKLAELARRRKALRERGHGPARLPENEADSTAAGRLLEPEGAKKLDRKVVVFVTAVAMLAVLLGLTLGGAFG
jgi:hypothetical protein